jgi:hypothetical protein
VYAGGVVGVIAKQKSGLIDLSEIKAESAAGFGVRQPVDAVKSQ